MTELVHDSSPDLRGALEFVMDRICEEAELSGEPLGEGEKPYCIISQSTQRTQRST